MTKDDFDKEIDAAAEKYIGDFDLAEKVNFIAGAAKARELMMGDVKSLYKQINTYAKEQNYQYQENKKLRARVAELEAIVNTEIPFLDAYQDHFKKLLADRAGLALAVSEMKCISEAKETDVAQIQMQLKYILAKLGADK